MQIGGAKLPPHAARGSRRSPLALPEHPLVPGSQHSMGSRRDAGEEEEKWRGGGAEWVAEQGLEGVVIEEVPPSMSYCCSRS